MNSNHDIGQSFEVLKKFAFYVYGGCRATWNNDGSLEYKGQRMALVDFHRLVDQKYDSLEKSIKP